jgi:hypothetical protein
MSSNVYFGFIMFVVLSFISESVSLKYKKNYGLMFHFMQTGNLDLHCTSRTQAKYAEKYIGYV